MIAQHHWAARPFFIGANPFAAKQNSRTGRSRSYAIYLQFDLTSLRITVRDVAGRGGHCADADDNA
jgi:hypothetical protein